MVSVIIPTYNRSSLLKEAVLSVVNQTYRPIECIVVDDGSTDDTDETLKELRRLNDDQFNLIYIKQKNSGAQVARNTGTAAAQGEYIQYLDSDDLLYPDKLMMQVDYLISNPDCDGVFGDWEVGTTEKAELIKGYKSDDFLEQLLVDRCIHTLSFLFKRKEVSLAGSWDPLIRRNQEIDFQVRAYIEGCNFLYQSFNTGLWRIHQQERIANTTGLADVLYFFQKMERILDERNMFSSSLKKKIARLYMWLIKQDIRQTTENKKLILSEVIRLDPNAEISNAKAFRFLKMLFGKTFSIKLWFIALNRN